MSGSRSRSLRKDATELVLSGRVTSSNEYRRSGIGGTLHAVGWRAAYQGLKRVHARGAQTPAKRRAEARILREVRRRARRAAAAKRRWEQRHDAVTRGVGA